MKFRLAKSCLLLFILLSIFACNRSTESRIAGRWELRVVREADKPQPASDQAGTGLIYEFKKGGVLAFSQKGQPGSDTCQYAIVKENDQEYLTFTDPKTQAYKYRIVRLANDTLELGVEKVVLQFLREK